MMEGSQISIQSLIAARYLVILMTPNVTRQIGSPSMYTIFAVKDIGCYVYNLYINRRFIVTFAYIQLCVHVIWFSLRSIFHAHSHVGAHA